VDPDTRDLPGARPGRPIGALEATRICERYSVAEMVVGDLSSP
jgi:hypothetical protein